MSSARVEFIASRDNPQLKELRRLSQDNLAYRKQARVWVEGDHLCRAALQRGCKPALAVMSQRAWEDQSPDAQALAGQARKVLVLEGDLFAGLSALESPAHIACVLDLPQAQPLEAGCNTVVLDRLQDAGNVGSILRSASAFGFSQVLALKGTAALWGGKVMRAGMGAHFGLRLIEGLEAASLLDMGLPLAVTSSHQGASLESFRQDSFCSAPLAWVFGHEGQGVSSDLMTRATWHVRIEQPGGEESINVAAAAAICLYASRARSHA